MLTILRHIQEIFYKFLYNIKTYIQRIFQEEYANLPIWTIVSFIYGIVLYFNLTDEPDLIYLLGSLLILSSALYINHTLLRIFLILVIAFNIGLLLPTCKFYKFAPIGLKNQIISSVDGEIMAIRPKEFGWQILLGKLKIDALSDNATPKYIRFNLRQTTTQQLMLGDFIRVRLSLMPPPGESIPGGYDFSKTAYFSEIGAVGYSKDAPIVIKNAQSYSLFDNLQLFRRHLYNKIINILGSDIGNFAAAIIIGETSGINLITLNDMRRSVLAHILCVSGLHISLVTMIFFTSIRTILNLSNHLAHNYNIKYIGAVAAIIGSFIYLLLSGLQVAATRAFIMSTIFMLAIFINRRSNSLRSIFFAALIILAIWPEYILQPSFLLSFSAVLALAASSIFELYEQPNTTQTTKPIYWVNKSPRSKHFIKIIQYIKLNMQATIAASLATTPFVLYFFHINANYSLIANLIAVPITGFILMPAITLALVLMPLNLDYYSWQIVSYAITAIIKIANIVAALPFASWHFGYITPVTLLLYSIAFIIYCVGKATFKKFSIILIFSSIIIMYLTPKADLIIDHKTKTYAVNINGELLISSNKIGDFKASYWTSWFGQGHVKYLAKPLGIFITNAGLKLSLCRHSSCCQDTKVIYLSNIYRCECANVWLNLADVINSKTYGATVLYCNDSDCKLYQSHYNKRFRFH